MIDPVHVALREQVTVKSAAMPTKCWCEGCQFSMHVEEETDNYAEHSNNLKLNVIKRTSE